MVVFTAFGDTRDVCYGAGGEVFGSWWRNWRYWGGGCVRDMRGREIEFCEIGHVGVHRDCCFCV